MKRTPMNTMISSFSLFVLSFFVFLSNSSKSYHLI